MFTEFYEIVIVMQAKLVSNRVIVKNRFENITLFWREIADFVVFCFY